MIVNVYGVEVDMPDMENDEHVVDVVIVARYKDFGEQGESGIVRASSESDWLTRIGMLTFALDRERQWIND